MSSPYVTLSIPAVDPPSTFRASKIEDVYSIVTNNPTFSFTYQIGEAANQIYDIVVRNNTIGHTLAFELILPEYIQLFAPVLFTMAPLELKTLHFKLNEPRVRELILTGQFQYESPLYLTCKILNVTTPVYVSTNLPSLI